MIAILEAYRAGSLQRSEWSRNLIAGLIVGIVALPLAMAFAIASGARPEQGLYTAIIAGVSVSLFGGSRLQIAGPTGAFVVILSGITAQYGMAGLQMATLMAGVILVLMGFARMGAVIKFIPAPVITGFTTGIGVIIWVGEWRDFFGLPKINGLHFHEKLLHLVEAFPYMHAPTVAIATLSLLLVIYTAKVPFLKRLPGPLVAMVVATLLQATLHWPGVATIGSEFGGIPRGLPLPTWPDLTLSDALKLIGPAFTIAMLGAIESLLSAVVADGMAGTRHDSNQELIGQGVANVLAPVFGGFAATGAIARTATNVRNGASSPLAGLTHALTLGAVLLFMAPLAAEVPLAALAAILFVVAWNMSEVRHFVHMLRSAPRADRLILGITFLLTVFVDLVVAVNVGVILAVLQFLRRMAESVETKPSEAQALSAELAAADVQLPKGVVVYEIAGPMFFAAVDHLERALLSTHTDPKVLILRLHAMPFIDGTGIEALQETAEQLRLRGVAVYLCEANPRVLEKLSTAGVIGGGSLDGYEPTLVDILRQLPTQSVG
jgi:SulP family sulfate permease